MENPDMTALVVLLLPIAILAVIAAAIRTGSIMSRRKYLLMEIRRTTGREKRYWKRQLHLLYFPFLK